MPRTKFAKGSPVAVILFQWDPEKPAWWYDVVDKEGGTWSHRTYGNLDSFRDLISLISLTTGSTMLNV
jgi:hypothetical protein